MNRLHTLGQTSLVHLARFDHPHNRVHRDPAEETAPCYSINFIERGRFDLRVGKGQWSLVPGMAFITWPGLVYHCRHPEPFPPDACLSIAYKRGEGNPLTRQALPTPPKYALRVITLTNRLAYLRWRLQRWSEAGGNPLAVETLAGELLEAIEGTPRGRLFRAAQLTWYAERVEAGREMLETQYAENHSLASLSRAVGISLFHFARLFRELTGMPPHHYLLNVRLARAAERLREGAGVTETCYACGFNNLSHFIRLFRRRFGLSPSRFRG